MQLKIIAICLLSGLALNAHAIDNMYNWNGLEFVTSGNATHVHPSSPEATRLRGGWVLEISDVEPKSSAKHDFPYKNKGGALAKIEVKPPIDPSKVSSRVAQGLKNGAAGAATTGNGYVALGALACGLFDCGSAVVALADWGLDKLKKNEDGSLSVEIPDPNASTVISDGYMWSTNSTEFPFYSASQACASIGGTPANYNGDRYYGCYNANNNYLSIWVSGSSCPKSSPVVNGVCNGTASNVTQPLETYIQSNYMGKGWSHHWAKMTAALVADGVNVFSDQMSADISGPVLVPLSSSDTKTGVRLLPGTTTEASPSHTGETEPGTRTTTTTTTAKNTYKPAPLAPATSTSPATGPSVETKQEVKTTTSVTNNITNITNITSETITEKDEAPEEEATDTPLSDIPELYKVKYPDGMEGVWNDYKTKINTTSFVQLIQALTPNISGAGTCPSWTIDLTWTPGGSMGVHNIGQDFCWIWPILKIIVIVTTLFTVRRLIFGG